MDDKILKNIKYIISSSYRTKVLNSIAKSPNIPTKIAEDCNIRISHISNTLKELKEHNLIKCINPEASKGRIYSLTSCGQSVLNHMIDMKNNLQNKKFF